MEQEVLSYLVTTNGFQHSVCLEVSVISCCDGKADSMFFVVVDICTADYII